MIVIPRFGGRDYVLSAREVRTGTRFVRGIAGDVGRLRHWHAVAQLEYSRHLRANPLQSGDAKPPVWWWFYLQIAGLPTAVKCSCQFPASGSGTSPDSRAMRWNGDVQ